ncbi:nucleotidyltransferase [Candidatus Woesearchaeota archaeon]|nr:nucleotidyltransferase [Candidatus Woesearchaeota archaeon]
MQVIIPLAGEGTRLRPHTHTKPKPLIEFAGKSCLSHILDELKLFNEEQKKLIAEKKADKKNIQTISEVIFITGKLKEKIEEFVKKNYDFKARFIEQKVKDGSAGAIKLAEPYINEPVIMVYVDTLFEADLSLINNLKEDEGGLIWVKEVEDYQRFGVCVLDDKGYIRKIIEKPKEPISKLANIGLYYIKDYKLLFKGIKHLYDNEITLKGEYYLVDALSYMMEQGTKFICPPIEGWYDAGKPETLLESHRALLQKHNKLVDTINSVIIPPVHLADGVKIKDSVIGPYVSISAGAEISNSILRDCIIGEKAIISNILLENSIVGSDTVVDDNFKHLNIGDHSVISFADKNK